MIPKQALAAAKEAMREVTPPPGVSKADWLAEHGEFALIAGAIAAAAPYMLAEAWHLAYWQGIMDERRGLDALECGPSRANPYRSQA